MVGLDRIGWAGAQKMTGCLAAASRTVCRADRAAICLLSHRQPRRATEACATQLWKSPRGLDRIDLCQITAEQVFIFREGVWATKRMFGDAAPLGRAKDALRQLIAP